MSLRKKPTLTPNPAIHHELTNDHQWSILFLIMMPNTITAITKAINRNEYHLALICISICICFFLLQSCLYKYLSLPKSSKSSQKFWLKLNMWVLYTVISFGFVYQFAGFGLFPVEVMVAVYGVVGLCSVFLLYEFVVVDVVKCLRSWRFGEDEYRRLDAGKLYRSVAIC